MPSNSRDVIDYTTVSLRRQLLQAEEDFLNSITLDDAALEEFDEKWSILCEEFRTAIEAGIVDDALRELGLSISYRIATLADNLVELRTQQDAETTTFTAEVEALLSKLTIDEIIEPTPHSDSSTSLPSSKPVVRPRKAASYSGNTLPPVISPAYDWILENIQNPYPSASVKSTVALRAGVSVRTISDWFKSVRRHIGWVSLVKQHFNNSRTLAVAAAERVFSTSCDIHSVAVDVAAEFHAIHSRLMNLYPEVHERTATPSLDIFQPNPIRSSTRSPSPLYHISSKIPRSPGCSSVDSDDVHRIYPSSPSLVYASSDSGDDDLPSPCLQHFCYTSDIAKSFANDKTFGDEGSRCVKLILSGPTHTSVSSHVATIRETQNRRPDMSETCASPPITPPFTMTCSPLGYRKRRRGSGVDKLPPCKRVRVGGTINTETPPMLSQSRPAAHNQTTLVISESLLREDVHDFDRTLHDSSALLQGRSQSVDSHSRQTCNSPLADPHSVGSNVAVNIVNATPSTELRPCCASASGLPLSPEALQCMLDEIMTTFAAGSAYGTESGSASSSLIEYPLLQGRSAKLSLEQRIDIESLLFHSTTLEPAVDEHASWPPLVTSMQYPVLETASLHMEARYLHATSQ
uniref:A1 mating-type protein n=1 Tax=Phanerodontia chrysosporium TaxID=2822231 RepID=E7DAI4_PHACH|nr:A1 mating-type protein [Phanerodontia chrysosporium]